MNREEIKNMSSEIEAQQKRIDQAKHQWQETQLRASTEYKSTDDLEQRAKEVFFPFCNYAHTPSSIVFSNKKK